MKNIRVAIVEDDAMLGEGLVFLLKKTEGFQCVGLYPSGEGALRRIAGVKPNVILMDIGLPGMSGIECLREVRNLLPDTHVIMMTVFQDEEKLLQSLIAGAHGYLLKKSSPEEIVRAILEVQRGGAPMTPEIARRVLDLFSLIPQPSHLDENLSKREREILGFLVKGLTYREIADQLFISPATVRSHLKNIYEKLHVHSRTEAVVKMLKSKQ